MKPDSGWFHEGKAFFNVAHAFYRPQSQVGRDLAILAAALYKKQHGQLRVLDAMTGCGVRPLRYQLEAEADWIWANEANPEVQATLVKNLSLGMRPRSYRITQQDANQIFFSCYQQRDFYDLVDIDSFGSPTPFLQTGLWATKVGGLLYLTNTDTRTTGGHNVDQSVQIYGACARAHPAVHEQGLRLLIGATLQQATAKGMQVQPVFSLFNGSVHRVMLRLVLDQPWVAENYGFLGYCHGCGHYETVSWRRLGDARCPACQAHASRPLTLSGPLWLGPLHDVALLEQMVQLAQDWNWPRRVRLLQIMVAEADLPPYYFALGEIGRHGQTDIPRRDRLIERLRDRGYRATLTHLDSQAIKTDAAMTTCIELAKGV
ncbi:MAG: tRNA (guanine-N1)-methyltransferase [Leptolyngbyaceae cyanobacterium SM1_1_3]|nr:tRNA (guanine-N1)-methyltransferase [Leptolyngbyaceae cyanobacterium SM1_1_3]NJN04614.1 tRNA (guanine-N1)-methyltransferase [Leptolyngbyaceae cyanobacterium RM1_1_2]NJO11032.1 tRNA (guanine-N1)-methyltransferase [Leptolyngbyaceae cyanobacterium SL_1_1]